ncbi:DUF4388 domain-containing protein [Geobacter sp. SVR]|uniref:DUF4388 domain-containing protein n=1 Tax=Geobacter sp. SVR TaxID=2495594 RepID=UPI00143EF74D|nr:DUF4388 domain-containing protein [Geobacter sp. SVR]BCS53965.1 hypothetical protein GSVR_22730 [Geobacter sp. SVR]GCF86254.1 hypothetical protein GSbR_28540 [Geobacter sp. SVR]
MSFAGDLEHFPIIDIIQLLHSTRKTGTLRLNGPGGESQLAFSDGYIVSANHANNHIRIGQILVEMNAVSREDLDRAVGLQQSAGNRRKPLIATLIESGLLGKEAAFSGLATLIEMTIVDILTWSEGSFALDVTSTVISDEYRYFPETLRQEIHLNTQNVLMDALRIYDEKMHDGTLASGAFPCESDGTPFDETQPWQITVDDLGLEALDSVEKKIPDHFGGLKDHDGTENHRRKIKAVQGLADAEQEKLLSFLTELSAVPVAGGGRLPSSGGAALAVIVYSRDEFLRHIVFTVCKAENVLFVSAEDEESLDHLLEQTLSRELVPLLVFDAPQQSPSPFSEDALAQLMLREMENHPQASIVQLVAQRDFDFSLRALQEGARYVLSRPDPFERRDSFADDTIKFLKAFQAYIERSLNASNHLMLRLFKESIHKLGEAREIPEVAFIPLQFASAMFRRCITFVVGTSELVAEKSFGIAQDTGSGASAPLLFRIPLTHPSVFQDVIRSGRLHAGPADDPFLRNHLFDKIGEPADPAILLMPIKTFGRTIAVIYADSGIKTGWPAQIDLLDIVARHAGLVLDNNLYRKKHPDT